MSAQNFNDLIEHYGHEVVVARYTTIVGTVQAVAVECNDCHEVLFDYDREEPNA